MTRRLAPEPPCPNEAEHTPNPGGWSWGDLMLRTHDQVRCAGCGLLKIWIERPAGVLAPCWYCGGKDRVDATELGEDDELICAECIPIEAAKLQAGRVASVAYRWAAAT